MTTYLDRCRTVPPAMMEQILHLTTERNDVFELRSGVFVKLLQNEPRKRMAESLGELIFEAVVNLQAELLSFPSLAALAPDFVQALKYAPSTGDTLAPRELAAAIIITAAARISTPENIGDNFEEFIALKWQALASILEAAHE